MISTSLRVSLFMLAAALPAYAQNYPTKTIRLIVPFAPGGGNDVLGRMFSLRMSESLGQTIIVDNRPGGGGNIGTELVAHAPADGYMLLYTTNSFAVGPALYPKLGYSIKELAPLSQVAIFPIAIITHPSVPVKTIKELVALAKKQGGLNYGSTGTGSTNHLTGVLFNNVAGINNVHIPYKGAGPMMTAIMSGEVEMATPTVFTAAPYVKTGRLRAIAVTSPKPSATLPGVPTVASVYPGFDTNVWHGYFTTAGTPASVIAILHREIVKALNTPEIRKALDDGGAESVGNNPAEFTAIVAADVEKYAKLVKISGAKPD
ncbi:MAG: tripartite tricarboxylate transporter substrate binding protein [Proteobacteria bacterium]|nr:tripartite tricarboxylate transporter substrate binding protein [Pseudomonadota bacterium]